VRDRKETRLSDDGILSTVDVVVLLLEDGFPASEVVRHSTD